MKTIKAEAKISLFPEGKFTTEIQYDERLLAPILNEPDFAREVLQTNISAAIDHAILRTVSLLQNKNFRKHHAR